MSILDIQGKRILTGDIAIEAKASYSFASRKARWNPWSKDSQHLAFVRGGQIWICSSDGTAARQLTFDITQKAWPTFSPDGKRIAYVTALDDNRLFRGEKIRSNLWVVDVESTLCARLTGNGESTIFSLDWLNDQTLIFDRVAGSARNDASTLQTISLLPAK